MSSSTDNHLDALTKIVSLFYKDVSMATSVFEVGGQNGLDFISFNSLFETFMGSVSQNIMNMSRVQSSMNVDFQNHDSLVYLQSSKPVWCHKTKGAATNFNIQGKNISCWYLSPTEPCTTFPTVRPKEVSLQRQWRFTYKNNFTYVLVQSHSGNSKNQALCSSPKYWFRLEVNRGEKKRNDVGASVNSIFLKLRDIVSHKTKRTTTHTNQNHPGLEEEVAAISSHGTITY